MKSLILVFVSFFLATPLMGKDITETQKKLDELGVEPHVAVVLDGGFEIFADQEEG